APNKKESLPIKDKGDSEKEKIGLGEAIEGLSELLPKSETDEKIPFSSTGSDDSGGQEIQATSLKSSS
uniref:Uncharacterized protein n=1 Tax=Romanomermis culicivorax TaxID=13658 RepID=A0A915JYX9_ROMCU